MSVPPPSPPPPPPPPQPIRNVKHNSIKSKNSKQGRKKSVIEEAPVDAMLNEMREKFRLRAKYADERDDDDREEQRTSTPKISTSPIKESIPKSMVPKFKAGSIPPAPPLPPPRLVSANAKPIFRKAKEETKPKRYQPAITEDILAKVQLKKVSGKVREETKSKSSQARIREDTLDKMQPRKVSTNSAHNNNGSSGTPPKKTLAGKESVVSIDGEAVSSSTVHGISKDKGSENSSKSCRKSYKRNPPLDVPPSRAHHVSKKGPAADKNQQPKGKQPISKKGRKIAHLIEKFNK